MICGDTPTYGRMYGWLVSCIVYIRVPHGHMVKQECIPVGLHVTIWGISLTETPETPALGQTPPPLDKKGREMDRGPQPPAPVNRIKDRCKNITFPQLRCGQ